MQDVVEYFEDSNQFHIIAHSFGTIIALKLAEILEAQGKTGQLTLIDGSPQFIKLFSAEFMKAGTTEADMQNLLLAHLISNVFSTISDNIKLEIMRQSTWPAKTAMLMEHSIKQNMYGEIYLTTVINGVVNRMLIASQVKPEEKNTLRSKATLIRASIAPFANITDDYDLGGFFTNELDLFFVEGDHSSILQNSVLFDFLNKIHSSISVTEKEL